jgi:hypothetical protein
VAKGLTAADLQAQIAYLKNIQMTGAYNPDLPAISSPEAVSSLLGSEEAALASGFYA